MIFSFKHLITAVFISLSFIWTTHGENIEIITSAIKGQNNRVKYIVGQPKLVYSETPEVSPVQFDGDVYFSNDNQPWESESGNFRQTNQPNYYGSRDPTNYLSKSNIRKRFTVYNSGF